METVMIGILGAGFALAYYALIRRWQSKHECGVYVPPRKNKNKA